MSFNILKDSGENNKEKEGEIQIVNNSIYNSKYIQEKEEQNNFLIEKEETKNIEKTKKTEEIRKELITPGGESELDEKESYTCTECSSNIEITSLDEINNIISFKCHLHGSKAMTIKDYLENMKKNTYLYNKCNSCGKIQNQINNNDIFNYCTNCKTIICNNCILNHDKNHLKIKTNEIMTKCSFHPKNNNISYCLDCNRHICKECIKHRKHMRHEKQNIEEIEPSSEEIQSFLNIINEYKGKIKSSELIKQNNLVEIEEKFTEEKKKEYNKYNNNNINSKKELQNELTTCEINYNQKKKEIALKYEKELMEKKAIYDNDIKSINNKYEKIKENNKNNYENQLKILDKKKELEIKKIENSFKQKIEHLNELLNINDIIYNTYNKNKDNYFYNINIINLLINYYENGNEIIKNMKENEDFMETINQKDYELSKSQKINLNVLQLKDIKNEEIKYIEGSKTVKIDKNKISRFEDNINDESYLNKEDIIFQNKIEKNDNKKKEDYENKSYDFKIIENKKKESKGKLTRTK